MTSAVYLCSHFCGNWTEYELGHHQEQQDVAFTLFTLLPDQLVYLQTSKFSTLTPQPAIVARK